MTVHRSIPGAAAALLLTLLVFAGCGDDSLAPSDPGDEAAADDADLARSSPPPAETDALAGVAVGMRSYEIILENLTPATGDGSSQPFCRCRR